jgi:hypothetical protein
MASPRRCRVRRASRCQQDGETTAFARIRLEFAYAEVTMGVKMALAGALPDVSVHP